MPQKTARHALNGLYFAVCLIIPVNNTPDIEILLAKTHFVNIIIAIFLSFYCLLIFSTFKKYIFSKENWHD